MDGLQRAGKSKESEERYCTEYSILEEAESKVNEVNPWANGTWGKQRENIPGDRMVVLQKVCLLFEIVTFRGTKKPLAAARAQCQCQALLFLGQAALI